MKQNLKMGTFLCYFPYVYVIKDSLENEKSPGFPMLLA